MLQTSPSSSVKLLIQASSYLGADVSDAVISLSWTVPKATGDLNVTTDAKGKAEVGAVAAQMCSCYPGGMCTPLSTTEYHLGCLSAKLLACDISCNTAHLSQLTVKLAHHGPQKIFVYCASRVVPTLCRLLFLLASCRPRMLLNLATR